MHRLHRGIPFHHADTRRGPREGKVRIETLPGHRIIARAARVIERQDDFRHGCACHGFHHLRARANNAFALGLHSHHEPGDILKVQQRKAVPFGILDEIGHLARGLRINDAADARPAGRLEKAAAIGDHTDRRARADARVAHNISGACSGWNSR